MVLRDLVFSGEARIRCVTAECDPATRARPDVEGVCLEQGRQAAKDATLSIALPPQSFAIIEAAMLSN